jgi:hypothetical protein
MSYAARRNAASTCAIRYPRIAVSNRTWLTSRSPSGRVDGSGMARPSGSWPSIPWSSPVMSTATPKTMAPTINAAIKSRKN